MAMNEFQRDSNRQSEIKMANLNSRSSNFVKLNSRSFQFSCNDFNLYIKVNNLTLTRTKSSLPNSSLQRNCNDPPFILGNANRLS